eukprot:TRINITY_DN4025_c0_g1_i2.p1 TRINITY_DN4025_c0_g1~~TRINITY_DN4025_c0_g1_i2.p1  ORF type:complete len:1805 (+),score=345.92 TRINITY_DN4025_c0_g1_i2:578-5416(+)
MLTLEGLEDCEVYICDTSAQVFCDLCKRCTILLGPCESSVFVRDCDHCSIWVASQQFRTNTANSCTFHLYSMTEPIIETSTNLSFSPWSAQYPMCKAHFERAKLKPQRNLWNAIYDFSGVKGKANWSILPFGEIEELTVEIDEAAEVAASPDSPFEPIAYEQLIADPVASVESCGSNVHNAPQTRPAIPPKPAASTKIKQRAARDAGMVSASVHKLHVTIERAEGLQHLNYVGDAPWVSCEVKHFEKRAAPSKCATKALHKTLDPVWNETHVFEHWCVGEPVAFTVYDKGWFGSKSEGAVEVASTQFWPHGYAGEVTLGGKAHSKLFVRIFPDSVEDPTRSCGVAQGGIKHAHDQSAAARAVAAPSATDSAREQHHQDGHAGMVAADKSQVEAHQTHTRDQHHQDGHVGALAADKSQVEAHQTHTRDLHLESGARAARAPTSREIEEKEKAQPQAKEWTLEVKVKNAVGLKHLNFLGDAFWVLGEVHHIVKGEKVSKFCTNEVPSKTLEPVWNETHKLHNYHEGDSLDFTVYDMGKLGSKIEGKVNVPAAKFFPNGFEGALPVTGLTDAKLFLEISVCPIPEKKRDLEQAALGGVGDAASAPRGGSSDATAGNGRDLDLQVEVLAADPRSKISEHESKSRDLEETAKIPSQAKYWTLKILVKSAVGLKHLNYMGDSMWVLGEVHHAAKGEKAISLRTREVASKTLEPVWNETHHFNHFHEGDSLEFTVYDKGMLGSKVEGKVTIPPAKFFPNGFEGALPLAGLDHASLSLAITVCPCEDLDQNLAHVALGGADDAVSFSNAPRAALSPVAVANVRHQSDPLGAEESTKLEKPADIVDARHQSEPFAVEGSSKVEKPANTVDARHRREPLAAEGSTKVEKPANTVDARTTVAKSGAAPKAPIRKLTVTVMNAIGLKHLNFVGDNPWVACEVKHTEKKEKPSKFSTKALHKTLEPAWNEVHVLDWHEGEALEFTVYDKGLLGSKTEGKVSVDSAKFFPTAFEGALSLAGLECAKLFVRIAADLVQDPHKGHVEPGGAAHSADVVRHETHVGIAPALQSESPLHSPLSASHVSEASFSTDKLQLLGLGTADLVPPTTSPTGDSRPSPTGRTSSESLLSPQAPKEGVAAKRDIYLNYLAKHPDDAAANANLGYVLRPGEVVTIGGRTYNQVDLFLKAIEVDPANARAHADLATALEGGDGKPEGSVLIRGDRFGPKKLYIVALTINPQLTKVYSKLARLLTENEFVTVDNVRVNAEDLRRKGQELEARAGRGDRNKDLYLRAIEMDRNDALSYVDLASVMAPEEVIQVGSHSYNRRGLLSRAIELDNRCARAYAALAAELPPSENVVVRGRQCDRKELYIIALELEPQLSHANWALAKLLEPGERVTISGQSLGVAELEARSGNNLSAKTAGETSTIPVHLAPPAKACPSISPRKPLSPKKPERGTDPTNKAQGGDLMSMFANKVMSGAAKQTDLARKACGGSTSPSADVAGARKSPESDVAAKTTRFVAETKRRIMLDDSSDEEDARRDVLQRHKDAAGPSPSAMGKRPQISPARSAAAARGMANKDSSDSDEAAAAQALRAKWAAHGHATGSGGLITGALARAALRAQDSDDSD